MILAVSLFAFFLSIWLSSIEPYRRQALALDQYGQTMSKRIRRTYSTRSLMRSRSSGSNGPLGIATHSKLPNSWKRFAVEKLLGNNKYVQITKLEFISGISGEDIQYIVSRMPFLRSIKIQRSDLGKDTINALAAMKHLNRVEIIHCNLTNSDVARLCQSPSISQICLNGNPITDDALKYFEQLPTLKELTLYWTDIGEESIESLETACPDLHVDFWKKQTNAT